jgi:hypothetical protein
MDMSPTLMQSVAGNLRYELLQPKLSLVQIVYSQMVRG